MILRAKFKFPFNGSKHMKPLAATKREELLKSSTRKKADPEKLLQACMDSFYPDDGVDHKVLIRFIELKSDDQAVITIRVYNDYYSATVSSERAINCSAPYDIIIKDGDFHHIRQKVISDTIEKKTLIITDELPPIAPESGTPHEIALYAPKGTVIFPQSEVDTVKYRTLYHLGNNDRKFVIKTTGNKVYEYTIQPGTGPFGVPGDFEVYHDVDYVSLITNRVMSWDSYIRESSVAIFKP